MQLLLTFYFKREFYFKSNTKKSLSDQSHDRLEILKFLIWAPASCFYPPPLFCCLFFPLLAFTCVFLKGKPARGGSHHLQTSYHFYFILILVSFFFPFDSPLPHNMMMHLMSHRWFFLGGSGVWIMRGIARGLLSQLLTCHATSKDCAWSRRWIGNLYWWWKIGDLSVCFFRLWS